MERTFEDEWKNEEWMAYDKVIRVSSEFDGSGEDQVAIASDSDIAKHIVALHNDSLFKE